MEFTISGFAAEAFTLFTMNHTSKWLNSLDDEKRHNVIAEARKATPSMYRNFKDRQLKIQQEQATHFRQQAEDRQRREQKLMAHGS
jgi:hypothetical protein